MAVEDDPRHDAPAPDGEQAQDDPQQRRVEELLEEAEQDVEEPEQEAPRAGSPTGLEVVLQAREDEAAEGELLADGRDEREEEQRRPQVGDLRHHLVERRLDDVRDREELLDDRPQLVDQRVHRQRQRRRP